MIKQDSEWLRNEVAIGINYNCRQVSIIDVLHQLGILAGSLAHQIKNPLSSIQTFAQLLPEKYADGEFRGEFSKVVNQDISRVVRIIDSIMDLSKAKKTEFQILDIHEVIDRSLILVDAKLKISRIEIKKDYGLLPEVKGDSVLLEQMFFNLFLNDIQAMTGAGKGDKIKVSTELKKGQIIIKIEDNGPGMQEKLLSRLFEPFTTTKVTGEYRGLGLGLFIAQRIIEQHNGSIKVESRLGEWTRFRVAFPV